MEKLLQEGNYTGTEVIAILKDIDKQMEFKAVNKVYYPYFHFEFQINSKGLLKLNALSGCVIDGVNGSGAIIDTAPAYTKEKVSGKRVIDKALSKEEADEKAKSFLFHTSLMKVKSFTTPEFIRKKSECFYRPYWVVEAKEKEKEHYLAVDAVTAQYHPI